jgi:Tfp pilus assembly ATPase PilU
MQHFDAELERMVRAGILDLDVALSYATNAGNLRLEMTDLAEASPITA